jgi:membrane protein implicated in regulation of membrane protease activity
MSLTIKILGQLVLVSIGFSAFIKYGAPLLEIPTNNTTATIGVFLPVLLIAIILWWRQKQQNSSIE